MSSGVWSAPTVASGPEPGQLVRVRGRHWVVANVSESALPCTDGIGSIPERMVTLTSVEDDRYDESLQVLWGDFLTVVKRSAAEVVERLFDRVIA